jgi:cytochrome P450
MEFKKKIPFMVNVAPSPGSTFATIDHNLHRVRRGILNPFFSKQAVIKVEHLVQDKVDKAAKRLEQAKDNGTIIKTDVLFAALTGDVICHYAYGDSSGILEREDLKNEFRDAVTGATTFCHFMRFFPILVSLLDIMPWFILWLQPMYKGYFEMERKLKEQSTYTLRNGEGEKETRTIFQALSDPSLPAEERTPVRLKNEAMTMMGAGTETTARVLATGSFHLYRNEAMVQRLRDELKTVMPEPSSKVSWGQLEKLPYLVRILSLAAPLLFSVLFRGIRRLTFFRLPLSMNHSG